MMCSSISELNDLHAPDESIPQGYVGSRRHIEGRSKGTFAVILAPLALLSAIGCGTEETDPQTNELAAADSTPEASNQFAAIPRIITARTYPREAGSASSDGERLGIATEALNSGHGIGYHGGRVMSGAVHVYYIWYGNWASNSATSILTDLMNNIATSPYYNINTLYDDAACGRVSGSVTLAGSTTDAYTQGLSLSDAQIQAVVFSAISKGKLPLDTNGVYFVLTSADVTANSGFCANYCGWHTYARIAGSDIKYAFVGNGDRCPGTCRNLNLNHSPNGNAGADGMANIIAHELEETVSDPYINAWGGADGQENADKCAWMFGNTYQVSNGSVANMKIGTRDYLIQENWINAGSGSCGLFLPVNVSTPKRCNSSSWNTHPTPQHPTLPMEY